MVCVGNDWAVLEMGVDMVLGWEGLVCDGVVLRWEGSVCYGDELGGMEMEIGFVMEIGLEMGL